MPNELDIGSEISDGMKALPLYREGWGVRFQREAITKGPKTCNLSFAQQGPPKVVAKRERWKTTQNSNFYTLVKMFCWSESLLKTLSNRP